MNHYSTKSEDVKRAIPLVPLNPDSLEEWKAGADPRLVIWAEQSGFGAQAGKHCVLPGAGGEFEAVLFGENSDSDIQQLVGLVPLLPAGNYRLDAAWEKPRRVAASLGWGLASYRFDRYLSKGQEDKAVSLILAEDLADEVEALCEAQYLVRDLVNTPTEHLGPKQLADAIQAEADRYGASVRVTKGKDLLTENFPAIHAVGRASRRKPRLVELSWGREEDPVLALVGKGVCFDTGGLDIKSTVGMQLMKKDMGGAAHALALARLVMHHELPVRLRLFIPAVENSISGNAYRPGDIIPTRKGLSVEIGNTDAEGRVILSDALTYACEDLPDLVIDFATLTGAARVALGADLPPIFSNRPEIATQIQQAGERAEDPLWTMPLYQPYNQLIDSPIADVNNSAKGSFAGCITAALFLERFVESETSWVHIDTFAWNQGDRPGRPQGGEALGLRAAWDYLQRRYA